MEADQDMTTELVPINPIRVETALPRFPIHRLAKRGDVTIDIREQSDDGESLIRWEISHNSKYGQPGPLAYKLDTLIVNRRIEEAPRPIPRIIRLGSLREIAEELGFTTHNTNKLKKSLYQNAFAAITAKIRYRQSNGKERTVEIGDTRYGVVFTGEALPDGRVADAVYIVLHDFYIKILNNVTTRPLDYDYLRDLAPVPQRFYELLSYQIYAALKHGRDRAKLVYSEFCTYAPLTRYSEFDKIKKQMHKIHAVHRKSGYIAKVNFHQTTDADGQPDWIMLYMPGPKAVAEFHTFMNRGSVPVISGGHKEPIQVAMPPLKQLDLKLTPRRKGRSVAKQSLPSPLIAELVQRGVTEESASILVREFPERIEVQIDVLDWLTLKNPKKIADPAAYLVKAIQRNNAIPKAFVSRADRERQAEANRQAEIRVAEARRQERAAEAQERSKHERDTAYWASLTPEQQAELQARADAEADPAELAKEDRSVKSTFQMFRRRAFIRRLLDGQEPT